MFTIASSFNSWCDETCSKGDDSGLRKSVIADVLLLGSLFAVIAVVAYVAGSSIQAAMQSLSEKAAWFMAGLGEAGKMMRFVGFGVLLKIMLANDMWGYFLMGFAIALIVGNTPNLSGAALLLLLSSVSVSH